MPYKLSTAAIHDIFSITDYGIESFGRAQAQKYQDALYRTFQLLADMPRIGREDAAGDRRFVHGRHVIIYRIEGPGITIGRIMHGSSEAADPGGREEG